MQAFLEGELPTDERSRLEGHVAVCARCSAELDAWRVLFTDLEGLESPAPRAGFADRVMSAVRAPARVSLAARVAAVLRWRRPSHVDADVLQDVAEGLLPARQMARARAHIGTCRDCARELGTWRRLVAMLGGLERFSPSEAFAARVMAAVRRPAPVPAAIGTPAPERSPWDRALALARRLVPRVVPRTRRQWAALTGVAVTPAAIFGLLLYTVFSHPTLTPQALVSFAVWQVSDLFASGWNALAETMPTPGAGPLVGLLMGSPLLVAGAALAYSTATLDERRGLYDNLIAKSSKALV
jgi:anti-sigma factor RsiW